MVVMHVAEEAEVDREEEGREPPCGGGSGGEAARDVRRAWAWRSVVEGSGGHRYLVFTLFLPQNVRFLTLFFFVDRAYI